MRRFLAQRCDGIYPSKIREVTGKVTEYKNRGVHISDFSIGRPDFDTPEHIKEAAKKALDRGLVHYPPSQGYPSFQEAVANRLKADFGFEINPKLVIGTVGASQALFELLQAILDPGDEVLAADPMYVYYGGLAFLAGGKIVPVQVSDAELFIPTAEKFEKYITPKTKAILLTSPNNPTGQVIPRAEVEKFAELAKKYDLLIIADDIYNSILYDDTDYLPMGKIPGMLERTIIINSFSKTYAMDGWRCGYLVLPEHLYTGSFKLQQHMISCPCSFVLEAATAALNGPQDCLHAMVAEFDRRRKLIMKYLDEGKIPYVRPHGAFYIFPDFSEFGMSSKDMALYLLEHARVGVVPGEAFGEMGKGHIRIAFSNSYEEIDAGMGRIMEVLAQLRNK